MYINKKNVFTTSGLVGNVLFAVFNGIIAITSRSLWLGSLTAYYILLSLMRIETISQEYAIAHMSDPKEREKRERKVYRRDSYLMVAMSVVLMGMDYLLEFSQGGSEYPGVTIYVATLFTLYKLIRSIFYWKWTKKEKSMLATSLRRIGYIDTCVSVLILQTALLSALGRIQEMYVIMLNGGVCSVVCIIVLGVGVHGITHSGV